MIGERKEQTTTREERKVKPKTTILTLLLVLVLTVSLAGGRLFAGSDNSGESQTFQEYDKAPEPVGGFQSFIENIVYPESAKKDEAEGTVIVSVVIEADGSVSHLEIAENAREDLDQAAIEAVKQTQWLPAREDNEPLACKIFIPVQFKLKSKK
jgi:TonB family protein